MLEKYANLAPGYLDAVVVVPQIKPVIHKDAFDDVSGGKQDRANDGAHAHQPSHQRDSHCVLQKILGV
jgi:hypothetical protein